MNKLEKYSNRELEDYSFLLELREAVWNDWPLIYEALLGIEVTDFNSRWVNFQLNNPWTILLGPRLFGKTQTCTKAYSILKSLRSRDERILILGKTLPQARSILREIRYHLEQNKLVNIFGTFFDSGERKVEKSQTELFFTNRTEIFSEPNISALGIGGSIISRHFSVIIADDLVDRHNAEGRPRELLLSWIKEGVMPMLLPGGEFHIIGSTWSGNDAYRTLIGESKIQESKAPGEEGNFKWMIYSAEDENRNSIWEKRIPTASLRAFERRMGTPSYFAQFKNDPALLDRKVKIFHEEDVQFEHRANILRKARRLIVGVDPATGEGESFSAALLLAEVEPDPDMPRYWIIDITKEKFGSEEIEETLRAYQDTYPDIEAFVIESVGFQLDFTIRMEAILPVERRFPSVSKESRHRKLAALFAQGAVGCCEECRENVQDFWDYPFASDDVIDAFDDAYSEMFGDGTEESGYDVVDLRDESEKKEDKYADTGKKYGHVFPL
jgi:phage terminase large subunit-like protein